MGYYSEVALKVTREDKSAPPLTDLWRQYLNNEDGSNAAEYWGSDIEVTDDEWKCYASGVKWYGEFPEVALVDGWRDRMLTFVEQHDEEYTFSWVIVGEEYGDVEVVHRGLKNDYELTALTTIVGY